MRVKAFVVLTLLLTTWMACADEKLPLLKVGSEVYSNVTVTSVTVRDIYFTHAQGLGNAKLKSLDPALQKHFHYDAAKANALEQQQRTNHIQELVPTATAQIQTPEPTDPKAEMDAAISRVQAIVNQPVTHLTLKPGMKVSTYRPGWFHEGAIKPDFATVDIRATRQTEYEKHEYVNSVENPGAVFLGRELEFNAMTKYFYTDRSVPKKKLSEAEMLEINRLYRIIGSCERKLNPQ